MIHKGASLTMLGVGKATFSNSTARPIPTRFAVMRAMVRMI
ncbi:Uncharacterised protein [Mycobacterium tuberculosis]|uniref:Uncharacterized protein n=1 Tax=Mycobacterium tuberculosis TaxID=1773 RepID=A0A916LG35_MYCTX|nr:Uncharacterised protein [Mycobacterium tuberculosis]CPA17034.1 Uncharacterised protein [Mycobacterium tuberculosis]CPC09631.1 Uncharacterised protein [Mycobacterium tuberculosis]